MSIISKSKKQIDLGIALYSFYDIIKIVQINYEGFFMKKYYKLIVFIAILTFTTVMLISCHLSPDMGAYFPAFYPPEYLTGNTYDEIVENDFIKTKDNAVSTFALHVNTAGYSMLRRTINGKSAIDKNQIKVEEIVNYFKYDYPVPTEGPLSVNANLFDCPWSQNKLLTVGLKAEEVETGNVRNNLVFLLDVSGSMMGEDRIGLLQKSFLMLLDNLNQNDVISIVTYAGSDKVLLKGENGNSKAKISGIIEELNASGSTAGAKGIQTAYTIAEEYFIQGGNNRVILATDGDFNVGINNKTELENFISTKRSTGIYLTVLGFGYGNLKDDKLEALANKGNGNYAYIDTINEARRVLVEEIGGTLNIVARDTKARVEFNPAKVDSYRLIGYENHLLTEEEWNDDGTDAGEIGSGFTVTAVYEVILNDSEEESTMGANLLSVQIRYKSPDTNDDTVNEILIYADESKILAIPNEDMLFISAVVEFCLILRDSQYKGTSNINNVLARLNQLSSVGQNSYRAEFKTLVQKLINNN